MKIEDIDLCATYWTVSGAVYPGAPSEVSPFPLKDRAEVSGRIGWRGMGFLIVDAITKKEPWLIQGLMMVTAIFIVLFTLIADVLYARLDPRIRLD